MHADPRYSNQRPCLSDLRFEEVILSLAQSELISCFEARERVKAQKVLPGVSYASILRRSPSSPRPRVSSLSGPSAICVATATTGRPSGASPADPDAPHARSCSSQVSYLLHPRFEPSRSLFVGLPPTFSHPPLHRYRRRQGRGRDIGGRRRHAPRTQEKLLEADASYLKVMEEGRMTLKVGKNATAIPMDYRNRGRLPRIKSPWE